MVSETIVLKDTDDSKHENKNYSLERQISVVEFSDDLPSHNSDEQIKSVAEKNSSVHTEKLWDGSLQLNTSTTVSTVAFFKRFLNLLESYLTVAYEYIYIYVQRFDSLPWIVMSIQLICLC